MHSCPECDQACYCGGDIDDIDVGDIEAVNNCSHCDGEDGRDDQEDVWELELRSSETPEGQLADSKAHV